MLERAQLVQYTPKRPNITLVVVGSALAQLGREVVGRPNHGVGQLIGVVEDTGHAEVAHLEFRKGFRVSRFKV